MSRELKNPGRSLLLTGGNQIGWTPDTPVPADVYVENLRRRGIDQLEITVPHPESGVRRLRAFRVFGGKPARTASVTFAEDHMRLLIPGDRSQDVVETLVERADVDEVSVCRLGVLGGRALEITVCDVSYQIGVGLPLATLEWLRERVLLEAAGLVSRPLFNVGRRNTRRTSNPDDDFYRSWPVGPNRLLSVFLQEVPAQAELLEAALASEDWGPASRQCHWLKSSTAAVGAAQLSEICQRMEINIVTRDYSQIWSLHGHFERELEVVSKSLRNTLNGDPEGQVAPKPTIGAVAEGVSVAGLQGAKILLAEDSLVNQEVAVSTLEDLGCITTVAADGNEAVEAFGAEEFDLILMDCQMPEMDGFEATRIIREIESVKLLPRTPIVALTANALKDDRDFCLGAGMNDYLSKPYAEHEFIDLLCKWLPEGVAKVSDHKDSAAA